MTVWGRLKGRRRASALLCTLFLGVSVCVSGCSAGYEDAYVLEERIPALDEGAAPARFADAFASDLCVVTDESGFDADFATSEAAALFDISDRKVLYSKEAFEKLFHSWLVWNVTDGGGRDHRIRRHPVRYRAGRYPDIGTAALWAYASLRK